MELTAQIVEALGVPVVVLDEHGAVVLANQAARDLLGATDGMIGVPFVQLIPARLRACVDELRARARVRDRAPMRLALLHRGNVEIEVDAVASGDAPLVLSFTPIHDDAEPGPRAGSYQLIFEHAPLGILHFDAHGVITACNQNFVRIIGSSRAVLIGLNMLSLPDQNIVACVTRALAGELASYDGVYRSATADKATPVSVFYAPVVENGTVTGGVGIIRDVTAEEVLRTRLAQADRLASLGTLAAGVAHEINNPLAYLMSSVEMALRAITRDGRATAAADHLRTALDGAERIRRIVGDLRIFSRAEQAARVPLDVHGVLDAAVNLCGSAVRHSARIVKRYGDVPPVWADEVRLGQVFVNLIVNAAHAIPEGTADDHWIAITTAARGDDRVAIEISDNGAGIPADVLPHVFEPFFTTKPVGVGTGLGLSICHSIVTDLGGEISIASEVGRGTTVCVVLRRATAAAAPAPAVTRAAASHRLLLVDDEPHLLRALAAVLTELHHDVAVATTGAEALAMLDSDDAFDAIVCDVMLAGSTGLELFDEVRRRHPALAARFVFMTGGVLSAEISRALTDTGRPRIIKPFTATQLEELLATHGLSR
ncbi:MAG TPA: ATP-binding protein [Kofleriaceae bacterium]|nr:ATP-binding protein [Kofleriaceae bacterium]